MSHHIDGAELVPKRITKHRFRKAIIDAWAERCAYCGCEPTGKITLDHVVPKCKGGQTVRENLVPACVPCNISKNHCDWLAWYRRQPFHCPDMEQRVRLWMEAL